MGRKELRNTLKTSFDKTPKEELQNWFYESVSSWAPKHLRSFPWRFSKNPYHVFLSEVLLRRTTSTAAKGVYSKLVESYPDITTLSKSVKLEEDLIPLGLNKQRGKQLTEAAEYIIKEFQGELPETVGELSKIPGIGHYGANAIACFGFGHNTSILDSNVRRIVTRFLGDTDLNDKFIEYFLSTVIGKNDSVWFNYGLLDMGATICKPVKPNCDRCPLTVHCNFCQSSNYD